MKLYSGPLSLFTAKVRVALREKGLDAEIVSVPFSRAKAYEPKHPEVLRIHPQGLVPVLVDGSTEVYDSTVILEYLEDAHPEPPLYPRAPAARARCRQLESFGDEVLFPEVWTLIQEVFYQPDEARRDAARIAAARAAVEARYRELEGFLGEGEHFCGDFGVADVGLFLTGFFAASLGAGIPPERVRLGRWFARCGERPSLRAEVADMSAHAASL